MVAANCDRESGITGSAEGLSGTRAWRADRDFTGGRRSALQAQMRAAADKSGLRGSAAAHVARSFKISRDSFWLAGSPDDLWAAACVWF